MLRTACIMTKIWPRLQYACYFDTAKVNELQPSLNDIGNFEFACFLSWILILDSNGSIPDGVSVNASKLDWWKNHCSELP